MHISDQQIHDKAIQLGLIQDGQTLPRHLRSRVAAALVHGQAPRPSAAAPVAQQITVQPGAAIEVDGRPFPWVIQADRIEVTVEPDGSGMVRLTIPAASVQILQTPESETAR